MQQSIILQPSQRLEYIDLAKGIGIMLVVIGHCVDGQGFLGQYIWSYHMPLFFMISGLCFNDNRYPTFKSFLQKRVKTLFIPCLYFTAIMLILSTLVLPSYYDLSLISSKFPSAYWFVFTLFLSELFFYESNRIFKTQTMKIIFLFICLGISALLMWIELELPYNICSVFIATFFYGLGFMMKKMFNNMAINIGRGGVIALFLLIIPAVSVYFTKLSIDLSSNTIPFPMIYYILIALVGIVGILIASNTFLKNANRIKPIILYLGKNTLVILLLHMFFISLSCHYVEPLISSKIIYKIMEQVIIWALLFGSIQLINSKAKWLLGK